jgi:hypothetical protein
MKRLLFVKYELSMAFCYSVPSCDSYAFHEPVEHRS